LQICHTRTYAKSKDQKGGIELALYHYTTETRLAGILDTGTFKPSENLRTDSVYGAGWYFTDLPPWTCEKVLMHYCWERTTLHPRVKYYMQIDVIGAEPIWKREHVYFVPKSSFVSFKVIQAGPTPECPDKPCYSCERNPEKRP